MSALGLAMMIASGVTAYAELRPVLALRDVTRDAIMRLAEAPVRPGPSIRSKDLVLDACGGALSSMEGASLTLDHRRSLLEHCGDIAEGIANSSPSFSHAHYVNALVAEGQRNPEALQASLVLSQRTAPGQGWLALSRAILAARHFGQLEEPAIAALQSDVATLARSGRGMAWLADTYRDGGQLGRMILAVVETLPEGRQRAFLRSVKRGNLQ